MNNPGSYMSAGSCKKQSNSRVKSSKLYWNDKSHSGIVSAVFSGPIASGKNEMSMVNVKSKWGQAGVYEHRGKYSPYNSSKVGTAWK